MTTPAETPDNNGDPREWIISIVRDFLAGPEADLAADEVELGFLCRIDIGDPLGPVAAAAGHAGIERGAIGIGFIVVHAGNALRAADGLHVEEARLQHLEDKPRGNAERLVDPGGKHTIEEFGQIGSVPPAVHIGFAEAQRAMAEDAVPEAFIVDLGVPGIGAVDNNARGFEQGDDPGFLIHHN
mgnify:CR=1 FL=1